MNRKLRRWVVKAGSEMVCGGGPLLIRAWMNQVAQLKRHHDIEVIWVTSGAIASAVERTQFQPRPGQLRTLPEKQALSALGQPMVMDLYNIALNASGLRGAQVLLTASDIANSDRRRNLQNTLTTLLNWHAVPILNENDAVATEEIQFGDNDSLSAQIARMMNAERLFLLTDVDGLYNADPKINADAKLVPHLKRVTAKHLSLAKAPPRPKSRAKKTQSRGTGGMMSKLMAAMNAQKSGIITHLVRGDLRDPLLRIASGEHLGTQIGGTINAQ
jgi:glutamate 5-kinase